MSYIEVVNIKCGGCEKSIIDSLLKAGLSNVRVEVAEQKVYFDGDTEIAKKILAKIGYPAANSPEARSIAKKAKSYVSCMLGRLKK